MVENNKKKVVIRFGIGIIFLLFCLLVAEDLAAWIHIH